MPGLADRGSPTRVMPGFWCSCGGTDMRLKCGLFSLIFLLLTGCAATRSGLQREAAVQAAATNAVQVIRDVGAQYLPPPWGGLAEGAAGALAAGLALWGRSIHRRVGALNGGAGSPPPSRPV
eukprot:GHVR01097872.1.p3 GENE.GHVR01097872.1~~GHVR01097872.1.p3  ORF type:complete len:122 (+),score=24.66 GHVR01097872.1:824-1189(+)